MNDISVSEELLETIEKRVEEIKQENPKLKKVYPVVVFGDPEAGEKESYVAYLREPNLASFPKFMMLSKKEEVPAMRVLAKDCFICGDQELLDDDSLFLYGLMSQLSEIISSCQAVLVNLSKPGK